MNSHVKEQASEVTMQLINSPKVQGGIGTAVAGLGGYSLIETTQTVLGLASLFIGVLVGLYALVNAHKTSTNATLDRKKLELQIKLQREQLRAQGIDPDA